MAQWFRVGFLVVFFLLVVGAQEFGVHVPQQLEDELLAGLVQGAKTEVSPSPSPAAVTVVDSPLGDPYREWQIARVSRVIDGDTIEIVGGQKVRYIGIDTPETKDPRKAPQCFGQEASVANQLLVEGTEVWLEKDVSETDKYGRLLRYVYIADASHSGEIKLHMVNQILVKRGFAVARSYPPDVKYQVKLQDAEATARVDQLGLWSAQTCLNTR